MAEPHIRVTTEDLRAGTRISTVFAAGDYVLLCFPPCHRQVVDALPRVGRHTITIEGYRPVAKPRRLTPAENDRAAIESAVAAIEALASDHDALLGLADGWGDVQLDRIWRAADQLSTAAGEILGRRHA